jgi:hypothetical protein
VSREDFETRRLKWPLTAEGGTLGCTDQVRWIEVEGQRFGLDGPASEARGYRALDAIWAVDKKMAAEFKANDIPNDPPVRINVGDMIEEAGKLC